jgi:hypothetical protein
MFFINNAHNCFCPYVSEEKNKERNPTPQKKIKEIEKFHAHTSYYLWD